MSKLENVPSHVDKADLKLTAKDLLPMLSSTPSDSPSGFLDSTMQWVMEWIFKHGQDAVQKITPFAIVDVRPSQLQPASNWRKAHFFRESKSLQIGGCVVATSTSMLEVYVQNTQLQDLDGLGAVLENAGLADHPMLVVDPNAGLAIHCLHGMNGVRVSMDLSMAPIVDLSEQKIDAELLQFHLTHTQYPNGYVRPWHNRLDRVMRSDAEALVRDAMYRYFKWQVFRSKYIVREEFTTVGQADISIYDSQLGNVLAAVFELKVLRSRGLPQNPMRPAKPYKEEVMVRHSSMGVRQAHKYRIAAIPRGKWAYLCLYDGRDAKAETEEAELLTVKSLAEENNILYRRYFMETSTRDDLDK